MSIHINGLGEIIDTSPQTNGDILVRIPALTALAEQLD